MQSAAPTLPPIALESRRSAASLGLWLGVALCLLLGVLLFQLTNGQVDVDDAPITYRYAENLARGAGYVYNEGEWVQGTSTPLYTLVLAGLAWLGIAPERSSAALNVLGTAATLALVYATIWKVTRGAWPAGLLAVAILSLQVSFLRYSSAGMETPFYTALIMAALCALAWVRPPASRGSPPGRRLDPAALWAAAFAALALLTRLDGLAVGGAVLLTLLIQRRRLPWVEGALYLLIAAPWFIWAWLVFGSPLPHSMLAKQGHLVNSGFSRYWIWAYLFGDDSPGLRYLWAFVPVGVARLAVNEPSRPWLPAPLLWLAAYLAAYTLVGIDFYEWYLAPVYPVLALLAGVGVWALWPLMRSLRLKPAWLDRTVAGVLYALLVVALLGPGVQMAVEGVDGFLEYLNELEVSRVEAGQWLRDHASPESKVATGFIGHVGRQSGLYVIDSAELVSPGGQGRLREAEYFVLQGFLPSYVDCGPVVEFTNNLEEARLRYTVISQCGLPQMGAFGPLALANARITGWARDFENDSSYRDLTFLETQWVMQAPLTEMLKTQEVTVYVHFLNAAGETILQADHILGRKIDGSILPVSTWLPEERNYTFAELPADYAEVWAPQVAKIRLGLWMPATGGQIGAPIEFVP